MILPSRSLRPVLAVVCSLIASIVGVQSSFAGCPPGESNPISSGTGEVGLPVLFHNLGPQMHVSFFILGEGDSTNSGTLADSWIVPVADVDGDGLPEFRIEAPGEGPGGWGDPLTEGCPSTLMPPRPPLVILMHHAREDLDGDGKFDVFEDTIIRNGYLDEIDLDFDGVTQCGQPSANRSNPESEDRDCDRRLTPVPHFGQFLESCEGSDREDRDCDGHLDRNEDLNGNGKLDPGEDLDGDGRLDRSNEDRNGNNRLDDRPFPDPADPRNPLCQDPSNRNPVDPTIPCSIPHTLPTGVASPLFPYGALVPSPGGIIVASVEWNGSAYDFDAINTPTHLVTLDDGRMFRLVEATPLERLMGHASGLRRIGCTYGYASRAYFQVDGIDLHDDRNGTRAIFDHYAATLGDEFLVGGALPVFPTAGNGAGGTSFSFNLYNIPLFPQLEGSPRSAGSDAFLMRPLVLPILETGDFLDVDRDGGETPLDLCPLVPDDWCYSAPLAPICDANNDGIGNACDPSLDPTATVGSVWIEQPFDDPGVRSGAAMVYDSARAVVVLFGGSLDTETWEYDGASWRRAITAAAPPPRRYHRMVFDSSRSRVLLFGGLDWTGQSLSDLWQYDGAAWSRVEVSESPSPRLGFGFAYDSLRDRVVLFGGCGDATGSLGDTWEFDGTLWRRAPTPLSPNPVCGVEMAFDSFRGVTVLRGSFSDYADPSQASDQTFEFDGTTWQLVDYQGDFPSSFGGAISFDPDRRQILLVGASEARFKAPLMTFYRATSATRLYDGLTWSPLPTRDTPRDITDRPAAFDAGRRAFVLYRESDPLDGQPDILELDRPDDTDGDGVSDPDDNCPLRANPDQIDRDEDEVGDLCDNCPDDANPRQRDVDRDRLGDACDDDIDNDGIMNDDDICPAVFIPTQPEVAACALAGAGNLDRDGDGVGDDCDRCPDDPDNDRDDDGVCGDIDNCVAAFNPGQADSNDDGSGDGCQPTLVIESIREDGGDNLEVKAIAKDPQDDPLSGTIEIFGSETITIPEASSTGYDCAAGYFPDDVVGEGIGYWYRSPSIIYLFDLAGVPTRCNDRQPDFWFAAGPCHPGSIGFGGALRIDSLVLPADICVRNYPDLDGGEVVTIQSFDAQSLQAIKLGQTPTLVVPFAAGLPRTTDISSLGPNGPHRMAITATDGTTVPVSAEKEFLYQGETTMLIGPGSPRAAICAPPDVVQCSGPSIGVVDMLDGSCSEDGGLGEPIVSYEWFRDPGQPTEVSLGNGPQLFDVTLPLGANAIALRVTDAAGQSDTAETTVTVLDDKPPTLTVMPSPSQLWPPNHRLVPITVTLLANDLCDPSPSVSLLSVTSSEPDDAPGDEDGGTSGDIGDAALGTPDDLILLRAERSGNGPGRVYELRYQASDASGNMTPVPAVAMVMVPHDQGSGSEPLQLRVEPNGTPGMAHLYWPAVGGAIGYDVLAAELAGVRILDDRLSLGAARVLARETPVTSTDEGAAGTLPPIGSAVVYVIQMRDGHGGTGYGTESAPWPRQPDTCDTGCP